MCILTIAMLLYLRKFTAKSNIKSSSFPQSEYKQIEYRKNISNKSRQILNNMNLWIESAKNKEQYSIYPDPVQCLNDQIAQILV